ncbi:MAG TPA: molybdopterin cofactor-binding domain-containing protein [Acetobacteraceae bacterium]|nr:molybdopterin cofactor-binding domain-containing protein [Acetobacteraceae bacterium]
MSVRLGRRRFLVSAAAGGLALGWTVPRRALADRVLPGFAAGGQGRALGVWVVIGEDNSTTVRIARSEMGQGTLTGLAQLVADELDADWATVRAEYVPPELNLANKRAWGDMSTGGSRGIRASVQYVREGGAAARAMLIAAAAQRWGVPEAECRAANSLVSHPSGRSARYGELAAAAAQLPVPAKVTLKSPSQWTLIGKALPRLDTADKLNGAAQYAIDVRLPGMKLAAIAQCPVFGGKLAGFDAKAVASLPGVRHVAAVGDNAVAVVADTWWQAKTALDKLPIRWDEGPNAAVGSADIAALLREGLDAPSTSVGLQQGDVKAALGAGGKVIEAVYATPFLNHATLEPQNCTALIDGNRVEIWVGTQNGDASLAAAGDAAGVPLANVKVNKFLLGGGFGRRGQQDYVRQAVLIAKQVPGTPVKLIWSREEDMQHGFYRPVTQCKLQGALDQKGNLTALRMRIAGQSIRESLTPGAVTGFDSLPYQGLLPEEFGYMAVPNVLIDFAMRQPHVPAGFWRGVNVNQNAVYLECFIDELAHAAGRDPLEFRRAMMGQNPKHLAILNAVAERAGWGTPAPTGVYRGLCQYCGFGSYTAAVAEVSVSNAGELKILKITAATDPGYVVNPDQVRAQVEGSFVYGLSALLTGEITIEKGRVVESNFDTYQVMRLDAMPKVETVLAPSGGFWGGVGEPTIAVASPAVLNAIFAATGKRIRSLPLKDQDLRRA